MGFVDEAEVNGRAGKEKTNLGKHVVELIAARYNPNTTSGRAWFLDFKVLSGPTPAGFMGSVAVFPDNARGGPKMPLAKAQANEKGKLLVSMAAVLGYSMDKAKEVITQDRFNAFFADTCPYIGRKFVVDCVKNPKKDNSFFYNPYPFTEGQEPVTVFAGDSGQAPAPPAPPAPTSTALPSPETRALADGWNVHPASPSHMYRGQEVLDKIEVLTRYAQP